MSKTDEACPTLPVPETRSTNSSNIPQLNIDLPCEDKSPDKRDIHNSSARSRMSTRDGDMSGHPDATSSHSKMSTNDNRFSSTGKHCNMGAGDVASQTSRDAAVNADKLLHSYSKTSPRNKGKELLEQCDDRAAVRNPITGLGLGEDGVGGIKPKKPKDRRGLKGGVIILFFL
ncbi:microtubule-associated protein Jupiter-like [Eurosta solidaginis]|uniref:microtubule-associated protein Jupiter-like n=1 Tax=Eurosta solidaginis TaxID=178769 RepID=UPI003530CA02